MTEPAPTDAVRDVIVSVNLTGEIRETNGSSHARVGPTSSPVRAPGVGSPNTGPA
ncbi:hypothetical protein [Streptomyces sp. DSM 40907]|uniref:hypothetical protein n=1 Tax=Streptomyces kutzneri TaxID=3051179 RepID=UPI0028D03BAA|nr:hypothetical protein [Streptomyces sp. DSM 40907]